MIDVPAMADLDDEYDHDGIADVADDSIVANPIAPEALEFAMQRRSQRPGIDGGSDSLAQILCDANLHAHIEPP